MPFKHKDYVATGLLFLAFIVTCRFLFVADGAGEDARKCTDADAIEHDANKQLNEKLLALTAGSTFFSIFSVALDKKCPFWEDDMKCAIRECSVCNCPDNEIPPAWRRPTSPDSNKPCPKKNHPNKLNHVDRSLPAFLTDAKRRRWERGTQELVWTVQDRERERQFVDLRKNPEQYTGYTGSHANSIWAAVYNENCFQYNNCNNGVCEPNTCKEERVLYRLISGVHTSITAHLAKRHLFSNGSWGENRKLYRYRIANDPERPKNLNVAFALVARAVAKASPSLHPDQYKYVTGDDKNDNFTRNALANLLKSPLLQPNCQKPAFDESDMFLENTRHRLPEFRAKFRNISKIMDCVGCEKCRLWGKLQFLGLGTALRILFDDTVPTLQRNEVIALINLLHKLSSSTLWIDKMESEHSKSPILPVVATILAISVALYSTTTFVFRNPTNSETCSLDESVQTTSQSFETATESNSESKSDSKVESKKKRPSRQPRKRARHVPLPNA